MSLISVIIPFYKKINYIEKTIHSILDQTYQNFEIIIIYDDSDLNELIQLKKLIKNNNKIKLIINKKNLGAGISRNKGIKYALGDYIAFIDADDIWKKNKLEVQIDFMKKINLNVAILIMI